MLYYTHIASDMVVVKSNQIKKIKNPLMLIALIILLMLLILNIDLSKQRLVSGVTFGANASSTTSQNRSYYFDSNNGNDNASGTSQDTPFKNLSRLSNIILLPGDTINLACGSTWSQTLRINQSGTKESPITITSYPANCTNKPIIDGSLKIKPEEWVKHKDNIYVADLSALSGEVRQVLSSNDYYTIAHHPNVGYDSTKPDSLFLKINGDSDEVPVADRFKSTYFNVGSDLVLPSGATIASGTQARVRTNSWTIEDVVISGQEGNKLKLSNLSIYPIKSGWGYYLLNQLWMLDSPGEWYYDKTSKKLYLWSHDSTQPSAVLDATFLVTGIDTKSKKFVDMQNLHIKNVGYGIDMSYTEDSSFSNSLVEDVYSDGTLSFNSKRVTIQGNTINRAAKNAILSTDPTFDLKVLNNTITESGIRYKNNRVVSLPLNSLAGIYAGASSYSGNNLIKDNNITKTGYLGIRSAKGGTVDGNYISDTCLTLDDCGGIYTWSSSPNDSLITNNIVINSIGSLDGKPTGQGTQAQGIYLDEYTTGVTVKGNTVVNADNGIQLHRSPQNKMENNKIFDSRKNHIWMQESSNRVVSSGDIFDNIVSGNEFSSTLGSINSFWHTTVINSTDLFAKYDNNKYFDLANNIIGIEQAPGIRKTYTLESWKAAKTPSGQNRNQDINGKGVSKNGFTLYEVTGNNMIHNSKFASSSAGWSSWNATVPLGVLKREACSLGFCLNYVAGASAGLVSSPNFSTVKGQWYRVAFDIYTGKDGQNVDVFVRRGGGGTNGYESMHKNVVIVSGTKSYSRHSFTFESQYTINANDPVTLDRGARIDFEKINPGDDISISNIEIVKISNPEQDVRSDMLINKERNASAVNCPVNNSITCANYYSFTDDSKINWPVNLSPFSSLIVYSLSKSHLDNDNDGIDNDRDICNATPQGNQANSLGCALVDTVVQLTPATSNNPATSTQATSSGQTNSSSTTTQIIVPSSTSTTSQTLTYTPTSTSPTSPAVSPAISPTPVITPITIFPQTNPSPTLPTNNNTQTLPKVIYNPFTIKTDNTGIIRGGSDSFRINLSSESSGEVSVLSENQGNNSSTFISNLITKLLNLFSFLNNSK